MAPSARAVVFATVVVTLIGVTQSASVERLPLHSHSTDSEDPCLEPCSRNAQSETSHSRRLISTEPTQCAWMTTDQVAQLVKDRSAGSASGGLIVRPGPGFVDKTHHCLTSMNTTTTITTVAVQRKAPAVYPERPAHPVQVRDMFAHASEAGLFRTLGALTSFHNRCAPPTHPLADLLTH
jgi:hypothetical protein